MTPEIIRQHLVGVQISDECLLSFIGFCAAERLSQPPERLAYTLSAAWHHICNFCNLETVPKALWHVLFSMAQSAAMDTEEEGASGDIKSVQLGDTSVTYQDGGGGGHTERMTRIAKRWESDLLCFRKLRW